MSDCRGNPPLGDARSSLTLRPLGVSSAQPLQELRRQPVAYCAKPAAERWTHRNTLPNLAAEG
ncbi:MAG: hypothetical protein V7K48_19085 [Nostoc sp.]|uniref:hypothetical protein n=1 Tax=Nostoc sp. TaxID=1180 RepID=UPI002FFBE90A